MQTITTIGLDIAKSGNTLHPSPRWGGWRASFSAPGGERVSPTPASPAAPPDLPARGRYEI